MPHYARTYGSIHHPNNIEVAWKYPTDPICDNFGVKVPNANKTFGLEEFNFSDFFLMEKIAYVPCYGTRIRYPRPSIEELRLVYKASNNCFVHYATLYDAVSFNDNDIRNLRQVLNSRLNEIYFNQNTQNYFGVDFPVYQKIIRGMHASNLIADNHRNSSFLINVKYKRIEILKKPIHCGINSNFASQWFINVEYPSNCGC